MDWLLDRFLTALDKCAFIREGSNVNFGKVVEMGASVKAKLKTTEMRRGDSVVVLGY